MSRHTHYRAPVPGAPATLEDVRAFAVRWHESQREPWARNGYTAPHMAHDLYNVKQVHEGPKWFRVDNGPPGNASGYFMVRRADGLAFCIKGYGVPDLRKCIGHVSEAFTAADVPPAFQSKACPECGRIMSNREAGEQAACNDCHEARR